jgi:ABC-type ATPase involved in cell division
VTKIEIHNRAQDFNSYRAARVKSLFNAENGCNFDLEAEIDLSGDWQIGAVVGPSGSGKSSIGRVIFGADKIHDYTKGWRPDAPVIDDVAPDGDFNEVTGALASVGLGDVPAWLRPFRVLSNGEQFRAGLARLICEKPAEVVVDEFTSVIDRQIARVGSQAFQKAWRRGNPKGKVVLLTPHYDILDWIQPDWVFDTKTKEFERGRLRRRPNIELEIFKTDGGYWRFFKPHYYLDLPFPPAAEYFVGVADGELACHLAVAPMFQIGGYRATRLVTMPEWQGAGVGVRFLNWAARYHLEGNGRGGKAYPTYFHTSHPQLCAALRRSPLWAQTSAVLYGDNKARSARSMTASHAKKANGRGVNIGYGGHFRAVQGFRYDGEKDKK